MHRAGRGSAPIHASFLPRPPRFLPPNGSFFFNHDDPLRRVWAQAHAQQGRIDLLRSRVDAARRLGLGRRQPGSVPLLVQPSGGRADDGRTGTAARRATSLVPKEVGADERRPDGRRGGALITFPEEEALFTALPEETDNAGEALLRDAVVGAIRTVARIPDVVVLSRGRNVLNDIRDHQIRAGAQRSDRPWHKKLERICFGGWGVHGLGQGRARWWLLLVRGVVS